jgi:hypothetical protein
MHLSQKLVAILLLPVFLVSSPALAQQARVVDSAAMSEALAHQAGAEDAQRDLVRRVLDRDETREVAARLGLDLADARSAVATLGGGQLSTLAQHAGAVESAALAGGQNYVVISVTTLLLILIIVLLLV